MGQRRIAGAEDAVLAEIHVQLFLERVVHVDARQYSEALFLKGCDDLLQRLGVGKPDRDLISHAAHHVRLDSKTPEVFYFRASG